MFRCERRGYLWVSTSKEIVCCQLQTPCFSENKNTKKLIQNTQKCCLGYATNVGFSNFRGWHFKIALRAIFLHNQPKKMPYHSQIFARKPGMILILVICRSMIRVSTWTVYFYPGTPQYLSCSIPVLCLFALNTTLISEHFLWLGYGGPAHWIFLSLCIPPHLYSSNDDFMLLYVPTFLYSNDVWPSKITQGAAPVPTPCPYCLPSLLCTHVV